MLLVADTYSDDGTTPRTIVVKFLLCSSLPLLFPVSSGLVNITVDDQLGDPTTDLFPDYTPNDGTWHNGSSHEDCPTCFINPSILDLTQVYDGTWHDATYRPPGTPAMITVRFNGSAVYVFNILPNTLPGTDTSANISFAIDGEDVGSFIRSPDPGTSILYNQLVYHNATLNDGPHALTMTAGNNSLILFDYLLYTTQGNGTTSTSSAPTSKSTPDDPSQSPSPRASAPVGSIVGGVLGGIALLGGVLGAFFLYKRHSRSRSARTAMLGDKQDDSSGGGRERGYRAGGDPSVSPSPLPGPTIPFPLPERVTRSLDGAATRIHNLPPDLVSNVPGPDARPSESLSITDDGTSPSTAEWSSKRRAELSQQLETLQRTRSVLSSQAPSSRARSDVSSGSGSGAAIRELEADIAQIRGVLAALNARLDEGCGGDAESLPAYTE